jgi:hypothetical protein
MGGGEEEDDEDGPDLSTMLVGMGIVTWLLI